MEPATKHTRICDIYFVRHGKQGSFSWKWRHVADNGKTIDSKETYPLYYECVSAARSSGYQPRQKCL
jgi:uncharacterized protein YegP (UPF0339 family)